MGNKKLVGFRIDEDVISEFRKEVFANHGQFSPWNSYEAQIAISNHTKAMRSTRTQKSKHENVKSYCNKKPKWTNQLVEFIYKDNKDLRLRILDRDIILFIKKTLGRNDNRTIKKYIGYLKDLGYLALDSCTHIPFTNTQNIIWKINHSAIEQGFPELKGNGQN